MGCRKPGLYKPGGGLSLDERITGMHSHQHIISAFVALQDVLVDDSLIAFLFDFLLEEDQIVAVIRIISQILLELLVIVELCHD